jgi:hypothetical protein
MKEIGRNGAMRLSDAALGLIASYHVASECPPHVLVWVLELARQRCEGECFGGLVSAGDVRHAMAEVGKRRNMSLH